MYNGQANFIRQHRQRPYGRNQSVIEKPRLRADRQRYPLRQKQFGQKDCAHFHSDRYFIQTQGLSVFARSHKNGDRQSRNNKQHDKVPVSEGRRAFRHNFKHGRARHSQRYRYGLEAR